MALYFAPSDKNNSGSSGSGQRSKQLKQSYPATRSEAGNGGTGRKAPAQRNQGPATHGSLQVPWAEQVRVGGTPLSSMHTIIVRLPTISPVANTPAAAAMAATPPRGGRR